MKQYNTVVSVDLIKSNAQNYLGLFSLMCHNDFEGATLSVDTLMKQYNTIVSVDLIRSNAQDYLWLFSLICSADFEGATLSVEP